MRATGPRRGRDQRGVMLPSPVVMLSVLAVAMAAIAFVATSGGEPTEREVTTVAQPEAGRSPAAEPRSEPKQKQKDREKREKPAVQRGKVYVEVYNNSGITGLAGRVAGTTSGAGWQVVGTDNWYGGNIPANTVYHPARLEREARLLALDLGIDRVQRAVDPMRLDRLTVILTGEL